MLPKKLLIFHPALAPYRIDQFNFLNQHFDLKIIFLFENVPYDKFDQKKLLFQLECEYSFLLIGPRIKDRVFRFGMYNIIKKTNPDIILGYEYSFSTQYLIFLKKIGLIKQQIGSTIDDSLEICYDGRSKIRSFVRKYSVKKLNYLILLSQEVSFFYKKTFSIPESQIIVFPLLQGERRLKKQPQQLELIANSYSEQYHLKGKKVLLFVGRFVPEKALSRFIHTISSILTSNENLLFILVGEGNEQEHIRNLIKEKHLEGKIIFPGRYEGNELYAWYLCASGFVLPSINETFGAVVNEAMIFGLKVLCSQYAGAVSLIKSNNGVVFDPLNNEETLKKASEFLKLIPSLGDINLAEKKSLMPDYQDDFINEWNKVLYK